ncbi:HFB protein [Trichoderma parareesei]|uniref:HFB protein n=1 Tax=Trichoderma parareesei TaxID=858221 RepID=A0A2H2YSY9_TRIPA|nr:HFB protein [Trichoderma parareesei]
MVSKAIVASLLFGAAIAVPTSSSKNSVPKAVSKRAVGEIVTSTLARFDNSNGADGVGAGADSYTLFLGDGSVGAGWPDQSSWVSFDDMFAANKATMLSSCTNLGGEANTSEDEVQAIHDGIQAAAAASGVDHRFILAILMQESKGCVRVQTTNFGVRNPGLLQDHDGLATCNEGGVIQNPCPSATITQMILEGVAGTPTGDGLANTINQAGNTDVSAFYRGARIYNSGSVSSTGNLESNIATHCYASDVANRLTGWVNSPSACTCDSDPASCGVVLN